ncbi:MAG: hypothetical protein WA996_14810 [Candidatus Promineifilaceae bacterium]
MTDAAFELRKTRPTQPGRRSSCLFFFSEPGNIILDRSDNYLYGLSFDGQLLGEITMTPFDIEADKSGIVGVPGAPTNPITITAVVSYWHQSVF